MIDARELNDEIIEWSYVTFGERAERGPTGPLKHLIKEAGEALADPKDILEYADCQILIWDAASRAGFSYEELLGAVMAKYAMLKHRQYPKTADGEVSEHIKTTIAPPAMMRADFQPGDPKDWFTEPARKGWR